MKKLLSRTPSGRLVCAGVVFALATICFLPTGAAAAAPADDAAVKDADHALVAALAKGDKATAAKMFDAQLAWTNSAGETFGRAKVAAAVPKPMLGDESGAQVGEKGYGPDLAAVQVASGKMHVLRIWAKRPAGWRLLVYQEVTQRSGPAPAALPTTNDCENPCKGVPSNPYAGKPNHITRIWVKGPETWQMAFSYQTTVQSASAIVPAKPS